MTSRRLQTFRLVGSTLFLFFDFKILSTPRVFSFKDNHQLPYTGFRYKRESR